MPCRASSPKFSKSQGAIAAKSYAQDTEIVLAIAKTLSQSAFQKLDAFALAGPLPPSLKMIIILNNEYFIFWKSLTLTSVKELIKEFC